MTNSQTAASGLRMAIAQQPMQWTRAEDVERIIAALAAASDQGARVGVFPELSLTGSHRGIREQSAPDLVDSALARIQDACHAHVIACALAAPTHFDDGAILNSYLLLGASGEVLD